MTVPLPRSATGVMDGPIHLYPLRVYYEETDAGRMVYHANYFKFAERARTEMMRLNGLNHVEMIETYGLVFAVHSADVKYISQSKLEDELIVRTHLDRLGGASMVMHQQINRMDESGIGDAVADLKIKLVVVNEEGKPQRLSSDLKATLERLCKQKG